MGEIVWNGISEKGASNDFDVDSAPSFRVQVPVHDGLAGQDTFKQDAHTPSSRHDVELRRMHVNTPSGGDSTSLGDLKHPGGEPITGSNMYDEFGGGSGAHAGEFTENKTK